MTPLPFLISSISSHPTLPLPIPPNLNASYIRRISQRRPSPSSPNTTNPISDLLSTPTSLSPPCHSPSFAHFSPPISFPYLTPPLDRTSPLLSLPDEILLLILIHLPLPQLLSLRLVSHRFSTLSLSPQLHRTLTLHTLPPHPLPYQLTAHILPSVRHLHLHLFPCPPATAVLLALLNTINDDQLISLSIPFASPYLSHTGLGPALARIGGRIEYLDLRGSGLGGDDWNIWLSEIGARGRGFTDLDLGYTSITALPPSTSLKRLVNISLSSCLYLSAKILSDFLSTLPPTVTRLDLSRLPQLSLESLKNMAVVSSFAPSNLKEIRLVGIDHLTRVDVRRLKKHWEDQRAPFFPPSPKQMFTPLPPREPKTPEQRVMFNFLPTPPQTPEHSIQNLIQSPLDDSSTFTDATLIISTLSEPESVLSTGQLPTMPALTIYENDETASFFSYLPTPLSKNENDLGLIKRLGDHTRIEENSDHLTRSIRIIHSAILESEDEEGYRQFIGEVTGGTMSI